MLPLTSSSFPASQGLLGIIDTLPRSGITSFFSLSHKRRNLENRENERRARFRQCYSTKVKMRFCSASGLVIYFLPLSSRFTLFSCSIKMNTGPLNDFLWQLTPKLYEKLLERHFRRTSFASWFRKTHSAGFCCIRGFSSPRHRPCSQHLQRSASIG